MTSDKVPLGAGGLIALPAAQGLLASVFLRTVQSGAGCSINTSAAELSVMRGGIDRGVCLSYWQLSYRRKLLRTVWIAAVCMPAVAYLELMDWLNHRGANWAWLAFCVVWFGAIIGYNWWRWRVEVRREMSLEQQRRCEAQGDFWDA